MAEIERGPSQHPESPHVRLTILRTAACHFPLAISRDPRDQSSARRMRRRGQTQMNTAETTATDKAAAVAAQGANVASEKAPASKAASQKKGARKAKKAATAD